jgi:CcmD family protein
MAYLFAGTAIVWAGIFIYMFTLMKRQKRVAEELAELRAYLEKKDA